MIVTAQRITVQATTKAVPATGTWDSMPEPIGAPNTSRPPAMPPSSTVASISGTAMSRLPTNLRSTGTS